MKKKKKKKTAVFPCWDITEVGKKMKKKIHRSQKCNNTPKISKRNRNSKNE